LVSIIDDLLLMHSSFEVKQLIAWKSKTRIGLRSLQIWCSSVLREVEAIKSPSKPGGKLSWIIDSSASHCRILLKCGTLVHRGSSEAVARRIHF